MQSQHGQALRSVEDLAQLLALWKPGVYSKEAEEAYFDARFAARERPVYPHPAMAKVLDNTYGQILYADQLLSTAVPPFSSLRFVVGMLLTYAFTCQRI